MTFPPECRDGRHWGPFAIVFLCLISLVVVCCGAGIPLSRSSKTFLAGLGQTLTDIGAVSFCLTLLAGLLAFIKEVFIDLFRRGRQ